MKKLVSLFLALIMVLSLVSFASAEDEVKITVFHYMVEGQKANAMEEIQQRFVEKHPEVKITFDNKAYSQGTDYWPQLESAIAAGDLPELIMGNPGMYDTLINEGYIMDLTGNQLIKDLGLTDGDMGDVSYKGKWYAYPIDFKSWGVFYNRTIFSELGIAEPKTKTELLTAAQTLKDNGYIPWAQWFADAAAADIEMRINVWTDALANGDKDMFEKLMSGEKQVKDYPYFAAGLQNWTDRMGQGWADPSAVSNKQTDANEMFVSGKAGMLYQGTWNIGSIEEIKPEGFDYGFFLCPVDDSGAEQVLNVQVDQAFMVCDKAVNKDWAVKFMEYWLTEEMGFWSDAAFQPCITGATTESTPAMLLNLLAAKASGNTACYGDFTAPFSSAFTSAYRKALYAWAYYCVTGTANDSGVNSIDSCIEYMQGLFDEEIAKNAL